MKARLRALLDHAFSTASQQGEVEQALREAQAEIERLERRTDLEDALEQVRAVALTMTDPAHMLNVCRMIAGELTRLGVHDIRNVQTAIIDEAEGIYMNYEYFVLPDKAVVTRVKYHEQPDVKAFAERMLSDPEALFTRDFNKAEIAGWSAYQAQAGQYVDEHQSEADSLHYYFWSIGAGGLGVSTYAPLGPEQVTLFKRFRNVFELAYRRYSDIRSANELARKAQTERERSDNLLLNILPKEVAEELKDTGAAQARHFDTATILFTDFKGFTSVSEKLSPQELVEELNTCFKAFDHIITARGIEKIKTIGDAYMAAGGLPDPQRGSPADVVHAALEMQKFMKLHTAEREAAGKPFFEMRVGIHTGPVVAGIVGVKKFAYDIWGDTVNTASRMESSGEVGQVNISEATYALVKSETGLTFTARGKVQAKGKGEMEMYFVAAV